MRIDWKLIMVAAMVGVVIALILFKGGCNQNRKGQDVDVQHIYDSIEQSIISKLPPPDTIRVDSIITKWLPSAKVIDTVYIKGETIYVYNDTPIDTNAILTHYLTQAVTYIDTIRDSSLQAVIRDTIFRNQIKERSFSYKIFRPIETRYIDNRDKFQMIASFQAGGGMSYGNVPTSIYAGLDIGLKFKNGTYFSIGYMAGSGHFTTIRAGQVIRFRKR